ncbi:redoxin domain-containing protein [Alteromonadaceae bacterium M269]|nr:redoxin domain-containing protein [Alteromonadaceae bacterium M269]
MSVLQQVGDLNELVNSHEKVIINVYRGSWCPFCRKYLKQLDIVFTGLLEEKCALYGVSVDFENVNDKLQQSLDIRFPLIRDAGRVFRSEFNNPISTTHPKAKKAADGYFLQPAIYIYYKGELKYQWQQNPKLLNLGGAVNRVSVDKVMAEAKKL